MDEDRLTELACLAGRAREGDVEAYGRIVELTRGAVEAAVRRVLHDPDDAEDVAQETYLHAFPRLSNLRDERALVAWLQRSARNLALNRLRSERGSFVRDVELADLSAPADEADASSEQRLAQAVAALPAPDRRLCDRYYHGGWSTARLATEANVSEAAIRKRLQRIRDRLRREMTMEAASELPQRVVELLSRPNLTALPENPVGAMWASFRRRFEGFTVVDLPETLEPDDLRSLFDASAAFESHLDYVRRQQWLRRELTMPMLVEARGRPAPVRLIATGKTYRIEGVEETATKLQAFHQAEVLWIEPGLDEWQLFERFAAFIEQLQPGARLRIEQTDFAPQCDRGWSVAATWPGRDWISLCGWGRIAADVVSNLGFDPGSVTAVGLGVGLERLACLKYGIDDARRIAAETRVTGVESHGSRSR